MTAGTWLDGRLRRLRRARRPVAALTIVLLLLGVGAGARAHADDADPWLGRDKALHFGFSAAIAAGGYGATALASERRPTRLLVGGGVALAAGLGKETVDAFGAGDASARDLAWDVIGTATGLGVAWLIDWLVDRVSTR